MKKKNILFVVDEKRMGGVSVLLSSILNNINIKNYQVDVLVLHNNGDMLNDLPKKVKIIYGTKYFESIDYTLKEVLRSLNVRKIIHKIQVVIDMKTGLIKKKIIKERKKILKNEYDVEIAFKDGFTAIFTAYGNSRKKVHWLHYEYAKTNPNGKYPKLFNKILPLFDNIIAVSDSVMNAFNNIYHLEDKTSVIYNLVDTKKIISKSKESCDSDINKNEFNVISIGRMNREKGYIRTIEVINRLKNESKLPKKFKFRLYGDGPELSKIKDLISKYSLEKYIITYGEVKNPYKHLKESDLFILSSLYESFGLVMVEAMTLGVPVLATQNHATDKIIKNKENGYIVDNSTDGLYEGLKYLISHPEEIQKYKKNLLNYHYDNKKIIKQIEEILLDEK